jgi:maltooligosyltrehalose trehalohydrolase
VVLPIEIEVKELAEGVRAGPKTRRYGPQIMENGVLFNLWAPSATSVELLEVGHSPRTMSCDDDGWYQGFSPTAHSGSRYQFRINGELVVPDPASHFQPDDVSEPGEVIDVAALRDGVPYLGRPWAEAVIYELHVGTFSEEGTYAGVERRLDYLRDLGITAIELMPLNDVPSRHNWGYDGVLLNAPNARYGRPEDLKRFRTTAQLPAQLCRELLHRSAFDRMGSCRKSRGRRGRLRSRISYIKRADVAA